ncbi:helix-turn-helix domain-containing protein [Clostridium thermarum]|uniref:helix-turn-helix domain-containing protein n=1 Tax=Clostridium thermarum TaxID=1716543 RepID=UPI0013D3B631|nr:transcriptional regulator [Clostridium thermarum]
MTTFGTRFKQLRMERKLTQEKLAEMFYLNKSSISRYENDIQIPEMPTLEAFAEFFDVSVDYLLGKTDIRKLDELKIPPGFLRVAKEAQKNGLTPEDVKFAIDWLIKARQRDEEAQKRRDK